VDPRTAAAVAIAWYFSSNLIVLTNDLDFGILNISKFETDAVKFDYFACGFDSQTLKVTALTFRKPS